MPGRNLIKEYAEESYYHIYNRGVNKAPIFLDDVDYSVFLSRLKRYLGRTVDKNNDGRLYPNFGDRIELAAYCLMPNHFHLFVYQHDSMVIKEFMRSLMTSYSMYFNRRYKRVGPVFQQRYRAVRITRDDQLLHITRYIHLNPHDYATYEWSSYKYYINANPPDWLNPSRVLEMFEDVEDYRKFVASYEATKEELDNIKHELADT